VFLVSFNLLSIMLSLLLIFELLDDLDLSYFFSSIDLHKLSNDIL